jgi:hypothetical protein
MYTFYKWLYTTLYVVVTIIAMYLLLSINDSIYRCNCVYTIIVHDVEQQQVNQ